MGKYIDAEKLITEIERRIVVFSSLSSDTVNPIRIDEDKQLLTLIDSLLQEQPSLPSNLDEAANRQAALEQPYKWEEEQDGSFGVTPLFVMSNIRSAFKAGAEWMAGQGYTVSSGEPDAMGDIHTDWLGFSHVLWNWMVKTGFCKTPYNGDLVVQIRKKQLLGEA